MTAEWPEADLSQLHADDIAKSVFAAQVADVGEARKSQRGAANDQTKAENDAAIAEQQSEDDAFRALAKANRDADIANFALFNTSMYTLASGSIERARASADLVQKASAAIAVLYTGILGLVFSVTDHPLPLRGVLTPIFLGLAVVLSTAYLAYLAPETGYAPGSQAPSGLEPKGFQRLNSFIEATSTLATRRSGALRASVVALGVGLIFIAVPFVSFSHAPSAPATSTSKPAAWPTPDSNIPVELNKILYQAQVDEVATARAQKAQGVGQGRDLIVLAAGLVLGGLAVWLIPRHVGG